MVRKGSPVQVRLRALSSRPETAAPRAGPGRSAASDPKKGVLLLPLLLLLFLAALLLLFLRRLGALLAALLRRRRDGPTATARRRGHRRGQVEPVPQRQLARSGRDRVDQTAVRVAAGRERARCPARLQDAVRR